MTSIICVILSCLFVFVAAFSDNFFLWITMSALLAVLGMVFATKETLDNQDDTQ